MVCKEDWDAAMSSEVFREYFQGELAKEAGIKPKVDKDQALKDITAFQEKMDEFKKFEQMVLATPQMKTAFKALQEKFINDPEYTAKVEPKFIEGVMMLDLADK